MFSSLFPSNVAEFPDAGSYVGARGFEPPTSWSQTTRSTKLSYAPNRAKSLSRFGVLRIRKFNRISSRDPNSARVAFQPQEPIRHVGSRNPRPDRARSGRPRNILRSDAKNKARSRSRRDASQMIPLV